METPQLGAAMQLRKDLAGIEQPIGVKGAFEALLMGQIAVVEHRRHQIALFDADPVLPSQHAADLDTKLKDIGPKSLGALDLFWFVGVVKNERMKVAVASMKDIRDTKPVPLRYHPHLREA